MKKLLLLLLAMAFSILLACATPEQRAKAIANAEAQIPAGYVRITGDDLVDYFSDTTSSGQSKSSPGWSYMVYREPGGVQRGTSKKGTEMSRDTGNWEIQDNLFCTKWSRWQNAEKRCFQVYISGENEYSIRTDNAELWSSIEQKVTRAKGNPNNL